MQKNNTKNQKSIYTAEKSTKTLYPFFDKKSKVIKNYVYYDMPVLVK